MIDHFINALAAMALILAFGALPAWGLVQYFSRSSTPKMLNTHE